MRDTIDLNRTTKKFTTFITLACCLWYSIVTPEPDPGAEATEGTEGADVDATGAAGADGGAAMGSGLLSSGLCTSARTLMARILDGRPA